MSNVVNQVSPKEPPDFKIRVVQPPIKRSKAKNRAIVGRQQNFLLQLCWILPAFACLAIFVFYAVFIVFKNGFNIFPFDVKWFFTLKVFEIVIADQTFQIALRNSVLYMGIVLPASLIVSLAVAHCLVKFSSKRMFGFFQSLFFLPYVTSTLAVAMTFGFIFSSNSSGLFNQLLQFFGAKPKAWLDDPRYAIIAVLVLGFWQSLPFQIIMFTIALTKVNPQYYQAASIDGAPKWKQFWTITLPQILPMLFYLVTTGIIISFKAFPLGLFGSERAAEIVNAQTIVFWIYDRTLGTSGLQSNQLAAAASVILLSVVLVITIINRRLSRWMTKRYH